MMDAAVAAVAVAAAPWDPPEHAPAPPYTRVESSRPLAVSVPLRPPLRSRVAWGRASWPTWLRPERFSSWVVVTLGRAAVA